VITDIIKPADFRYERKFFISDLSRYEVEQIIKINPASFSEIYFQRFVNNVYYDTVNLTNYAGNVYGVAQRLKTRIRWYGELFGLIEKPVLELKIKEGFLGGKVRYSLKPFYLDDNYSPEIRQDMFAEAGVPDILVEYLKSLRGALLNRYSRKYFESADKKFRITIDAGMEAYRIGPVKNTFMEKTVDAGNVILELKYAEENDEEARLVTNHFPFRMTKSSKYATGMEGFHP